MRQVRKSQANLCRRSVAELVDQACVAGEIGEHTGLGMRERPSMEPRHLERGLQVADPMFGRVGFEVAPVKPTDELLAIGNKANADLGECGIEDAIIR